MTENSHMFGAKDPLSPTIFHEDWWLDVASHKAWDAAEVREQGNLVARMPYYIKKSRCIKTIIMPRLSHFLGPAVIDGEGSENTRLIRRIELTRQLIAQLPKVASSLIKCHRGVTDVIPFQMEGFTASVQFTHELAAQPIDQVWRNLRSPRRTIIRGAQKRGEVGTLEDTAAFMHFYDKNLSLTGKDSRFDSLHCQAIIEAALRRHRGKIYAYKEKGELQAAVFCVWDDVSSYYLMTTRSPTSHSGAVSLLAYSAIEDAMKRGLIFDFDGLCDAGGVMFFAGFGAKTVPRYIVRREKPCMKLYRALIACMSEENCFA